MARVPASEATRKRLNDMLAGQQNLERSAPLREAVRLIVEETLEAEVSDELGRGYYDRAQASGGGQRNGYRVGRLDSAEGAINFCQTRSVGVQRCVSVHRRRR